MGSCAHVNIFIMQAGLLLRLAGFFVPIFIMKTYILAQKFNNFVSIGNCMTGFFSESALLGYAYTHADHGLCLCICSKVLCLKIMRVVEGRKTFDARKKKCFGVSISLGLESKKI